MRQNRFWLFVLASAAVLIFLGATHQEKSLNKKNAGYESLIQLFKEFRNFQKPKIANGVPDYSKAAMEKQKREFPDFQKRLAAITPRTWPVAHRVDYEIVRAEMNGLEFDHRVLRPWSRDPCFYAVITTSGPDVPAREGPEIYGALCLTDFPFPLSGDKKAEFRDKLKAIPAILAQAKINLTEDARDLWRLGIRQKKEESAVLDDLAARLAKLHPDLAPVAEGAKSAVDGFRDWLEQKSRAMTAPSGIGIAEFNWYMKNVHLVPYTWQEQYSIVQRELERALSYLKLEEHRNLRLPPLERPSSKEELQRRLKEGVETYMNFLRRDEIFTVPDYMRLNTEVSGFIPAERRDFFTQVDYLDPLPLLCHSVHWLEKQRETRNLHPIRGLPLLYNIWDSRAEGFATAFEEMMLQAGLFDKNPRARELVYILLVFRCVRAIDDLKLHSGEFSLDDAVKFAVENTPRGWVLPDGDTIWGDLTIYLHQPGYGTSYVVGKVQVEKTMADYARQKGETFRLKLFLDELFTKGLIPASLIRWEMTGLEDEVRALE
jgi:hypothetical protein